MIKEYIEIAARAARAAGEIISRDFGKRLPVGFKDRGNPVTETDLQAERAITSILSKEFPAHDIMTEESAQSARGSEFLWIIDPMDGTTNFTHGYPCVSVSIALTRAGELLLGVVFDPLHDELFSAEKGVGSTMNEATLRVSAISSIEESLLCTGFPYRLREEPADNFEIFQKLSLLAQGVRRDGSAALDLCYVAAGRFDGFWERGLRPWDTAAGTLILREAGGSATDYAGGAYQPFLNEIVASNSLIHGEMLRAFR